VGSFPLFGYHLEDYDALYASKLDLLLAVNRQERVTWKGPFRDIPLEDALVVPRAERPLKIWLGTGGNPESSVRAGTLGLPVAYGILSGRAEQWAGMASLYREAGRRTGYDPAVLDVAVASHGFIAEDGDQARETFFQYEMAAMAAHAGARGTPRPGRSRLEANYGPGGMVFAGSPTEIARRLVDFQRVLGHSRQIIQMDLGHMPQAQVLRSIELLGTQVLPMVRDALA
jgi:alkanesulfonate monooxygenase SsuD/methylene tetrahydromethanopterin reductase-like flavin-dependent oxidoreductase (luciferase family)